MSLITLVLFLKAFPDFELTKFVLCLLEMVRGASRGIREDKEMYLETHQMFDDNSGD